MQSGSFEEEKGLASFKFSLEVSLSSSSKLCVLSVTSPPPLLSYLSLFLTEFILIGIAHFMRLCMRACVCACVRACVRACVCACVCVCVCV